MSKPRKPTNIDSSSIGISTGKLCFLTAHNQNKLSWSAVDAGALLARYVGDQFPNECGLPMTEPKVLACYEDSLRDLLETHLPFQDLVGTGAQLIALIDSIVLRWRQDNHLPLWLIDELKEWGFIW